jgi:ABC-type transport system substrate-binding protein
LIALVLAACQPRLVIETSVVTQSAPAVPTQIISATLVTTLPREIFTTPHPILSDVRVRRAIAHCTDRRALIQSVYPWLTPDEQSALIRHTFTPREHWAYAGDEHLALYPFDPERGQALLEEAGWKLPEGSQFRQNDKGEELSLRLTTTEAEFRKTWAAVFEQQMAECGLRLVRLHEPAAWWFGETTGLARRDFELAAFAWVAAPEPNMRAWYACDQIPTPQNEWRGQNYMGWCKARADNAIRTATKTLLRATRQEAYRVVQEEFTQDLPSLTLFSRVEMMAINPALEHFASDASEPYFTWNAAQWRIPGQDTITIGERSEPASLAPWESAFVTHLLRRLFAGADYTHLRYDYQPVMLKQLPTLENGGAVKGVVEVREGARVVDADGNAVELRPGVIIRDVEGKEVEFAGGAAAMNQLVVTYEFVEGLTWSDGTPVSQADYELAYRIECDPTLVEGALSQAERACPQIAAVDFISDAAYRVTWQPGYQDSEYFLPPFGRQPAHQVLSDGRRLADALVDEWPWLDEVHRRPLGVGPYVLERWEFGKEMVFRANPYYYGDLPATPNIVVRFFEQRSIAATFANGQMDVLGWDSTLPEQAEILVNARSAGNARVFFLPSATFEHIDFALFVR